MNHRQVSDEKAKYHSIKSIAAILLRPKTMAISPLLPPNGRPQEMRAAQLLRRCGLRLVSAIAGIIAVPPVAPSSDDRPSPSSCLPVELSGEMSLVSTHVLPLQRSAAPGSAHK